MGILAEAGVTDTDAVNRPVEPGDQMRGFPVA